MQARRARYNSYAGITQTIQTIMKMTALIAMAFAAPLTMAQDAPAPVAEQPATTTCAPEAAEAAVDELLAILAEQVETLESVTDKASADAAAEKLQGLQTRMLDLQSKMEALGEPDEATEQKLAEKMIPAIFSLMPRMQAAVERIQKDDFYGSETLKEIASKL